MLFLSPAIDTPFGRLILLSYPSLLHLRYLLLFLLQSLNIEARDLQTDIPLVHILSSPQFMINCLAIIQHHDGAHDPDSNGRVPPHDT